MIRLVQGNNNTSIYGADEWSLWVLDKELRYPTSVANNPATKYAQTTGDGWDGWVRLLRRPKTAPHFPTGLISLVAKVWDKMGVKFEIEDTRQKPDEGFPEFPAGLTLRDYQAEALRATLGVSDPVLGGVTTSPDTPAPPHGRGVWNMVPRSGKTSTALALVARLGLPTIWLAPTDAIIKQTLRAFDRMLPGYAYHQIGAKNLEKAINSRTILCTTSTATRLPPDVYNTREVLIADEVHHSASKSFVEITKLCPHIYYRYGLSGTFFRSGDDEMAMHAFLGNEIFRVTSEQLLEKGHLVPTRVVYIPCDAPRLRCPGDDNRVAPYLKYGIQEHKYRNQLCAYAAAYLHNILDRKVLVLVSTKQQGRELERMISQQIPGKAADAQFDPVEFVSTDRKRNIQQQIIKAYNETREVRVLIGTSLLGEGVDLPPADALVYARGGKAEVELAQNSFRVCTAYPGKTDAIIVDFADRHNKNLMKHSTQRLASFHAEPIMAVEVLETIKQFPGWCKRYKKE